MGNYLLSCLEMISRLDEFLTFRNYQIPGTVGFELSRHTSTRLPIIRESDEEIEEINHHKCYASP